MATITATGVTQAAVNSAVAQAHDGDTVIVPAGSATWATGVAISVGITLKGAGIGKTIITNTASSQNENGCSVDVQLGTVKQFNLSGFDFRGLNAFRVSGSKTTQPFWVDSCNFDNGQNNTVFAWFEGNCYGLLSNCTATAGAGSEMFHNMGVGPANTAGWTDDFVPGSINQVYFEDCTFTKNPYIDDYFWGTAILESYYGARTVVRHSNLYYCDIDQHGTAGNVGTRWYEFYNNTWHIPAHGSTGSQANQSSYLVLRAGSGVVFNNSVVWDGNTPITGGLNIYEENSTQEEVVAGQASPELYQPGRGINQNLSPIYYWNNIDGNGSAWPVGLNGSDQNPPFSYSNSNVVSGRDVISVSNGNGIKKSQAAADGGNVSTNGVTYNFTPLAYPHPFRSTGGDTTPPTVSLTAPASGATVSGTITISATASDNVGVAYVQFRVDGTNIGGQDTTSPYTMQWDTTTIANGVHAITVVAVDTSNNSTTSTAINITVSNVVAFKTYYVAKTGSDSNAGTLSSPWLTIGHGQGQLHSGDTLYIRAGTYTETVFISSGVTAPNGTSGQYTTISAYQGEQVIVFGTGYSGDRLTLVGMQYFTLNGISVTNTNQGIFIRGGSSNCTISNCSVYFIGQEAFHCCENSSFITYDSCIAHDTRQFTNFDGEGFYIGTGDAAPVDNTHDITIKHCAIYNCTDEGIELKIGTYNCIVDGNTLYRCNLGSNWSQNGSNVGTIEVNQAIGTVQNYGSNPNHIIRNNTIHACGATAGLAGTAIRAGTGCLVYNNVIYDVTGGYGVYVDNQSTDTYTRRIYNNTINLPTARAVFNAGGTQDVRNNIGPTATGNLATTNADFVSVVVGSENFHLVAGSAPVDTGVNLSTYFTIDKDGISRPQGSAWDIGAYELVASAPSQPTAFTVKTISSSEIDLAWTQSTDPTYAQNTLVYLIERGTGSTPVFAQVAISPAGASTYKDTGLAPSTTYTYRMRAQNLSNAIGPYTATPNPSATTLGGGTTSTSTPGGKSTTAGRSSVLRRASAKLK